jgi:hypothetical protein
LAGINQGGITWREQRHCAALAIAARSLQLSNHDAVPIVCISRHRRKFYERDWSRRETSERGPAQQAALNGTIKREPLGKMEPAIATNLFRMVQPGVQPV